MHILIDEKTREDTNRRCDETLSKFQVDTLNDADGVRRFRCWDGKSGIYSFNVIECGSDLIVTGDMGEWVWRRQPRMIEWADGSEIDYFYGKCCAWKEGELHEFWPEAALDWLSEWGVTRTRREDLEELAMLKETWANCDFADERSFHQMLWDSKHFSEYAGDVTLKRYTFRAMWVHRAIQWLANQLKQEAVKDGVAR